MVMAASSLRTKVDRARYKAEHVGFAMLSAPLMRTWHFFVDPRMRAPTSAEAQAILRRYRALLDEDLENVERGIYPRELLSLPLGTYLRRVPEGLLDMPRVYVRQLRGRYDDLPAAVDAEQYPGYYLRTFHWQTDGWFSDHSARLYDVSVEALFLGTADVLRRMTLAPIVRHAKERRLDAPRLVDLATGTGRFLAQAARIWPRARLFGVDLSPNYLRSAHELLRDHPGVSLLAENVERTSLESGAADVVTSVFFFHEVPRQVRRRVMQEAYRLLTPGGLFVVNDSAQLVESAEIRSYLEAFPAIYHEPYYKGYLSDPLEDALAECGFEVLSSRPHYVSKVVVARKPVAA